MPFPLAIAAILALGPAGDARLEGDLDAAQRARSTVYEDGADVARAEVALQPRLTLATDGQLQLRLAYEPTFVLPADLAGNTPGLSGPLDERSVLLHRVRAGAGLELAPWRLEAGAAHAFGRTLLIGEPAAGTPAGEPVATSARIPYQGFEATLGASGEPSRRTRLRFATGFTGSRGADEAARRQLPMMRELRVGATASRSLSPRQELGLDLLGSRARVGEDRTGDAGYLRAGATWSYRWSRGTALRTAAGAAFTYDRVGPDDPPVLREAPSVLPWLEGSLEHVPGETRPSARLGLALEPAVDRFDGVLDVRSTVTGAVDWAPFRRWTFGLRASSASRFRPAGAGLESPHTSIHAASVSAGLQLLEALRVGVGAGSTWQDSERAGLPRFREDLVTVELTAGVFSL